MDTKQAFQLIDSILPFEVCLYYQIIPLSLDGTSLKLGMVNPNDSSALDYARRILAYLNCSFKTQMIPSEEHHAMLSAYLNHNGAKSKSGTLSQQPPKNPPPPPKNPLPAEGNERPTLIVDKPDKVIADQPTLIVDKPDRVLADLPAKVSNPKIVNEPVEISKPKEIEPLKAAGITEKIQQKLVQERRVKQSDLSLQANHLPLLEVQAQHRYEPIEILATLPPPQMLQELLVRVLDSGIGRLYFERQQQQARILWSQNGVLQSVLPEISPSLLQGLINELKRMASLSLISVQKPQQVDIERNYQGNRLLLSLQIIPGKYGEEATLQVLRGAALKFYQQQQLSKLSRDALGLTQQLQRKLNEIKERASFHSQYLDALVGINQTLENLDKELKSLGRLQITKRSDEQSS